MQLTKQSKILSIIGIILLILILTNPTQSDFKNYLNAKNINNSGAGRTGYFLVFSIYENSSPRISGNIIYRNQRSEGKYMGIFKNFIVLSQTTQTESHYENHIRTTE